MNVVKALQGLAALLATALVATVLAHYGDMGALLPIPVGVFAGAMGYIFLLYSSEPEIENWDDDPLLAMPQRESAA